MYRYVTKEDNDTLHSLCHPDLTDVPPQTESAVAMKKRKAKDTAVSLRKEEVIA